MTTTLLRVGIIGAGQAGERHAVGFDQTATTQVVAVADLDATRAHALAARFNATAFTDWRAMLAHGLDILVVCLPHHMHVAPAEAATALQAAQDRTAAGVDDLDGCSPRSLPLRA